MDLSDILEYATPIEEMLYIRAAQRKSPIRGVIELLPLCNMNCSMCYVRLSRAEMEAQGRMRTVEEWLAVAEEMKKAGTLFVTLTGGEPLIFPEFKRLYLELKKMGMILMLNTNGTLIDEEWADFFAENPPRRINITLYGADADTYEKLCGYRAGFEKVLRAIRLLKDRGLSVKINGSITDENCADGEKIIEIAESLDAVYKLDTYMYPGERERNRPFDQQARMSPEKAAANKVKLMKKEHEGDAEKFADIVKQILESVKNTVPGSEEEGGRKFFCKAGYCAFAINWQGEMRPCIMVTEPSVSVFEKGFAQAWKENMQAVDRIVLSAKCNACALKEACQVCAASALLETGDYAGTPEYMCRYTKEFVRLLQELDVNK